MAIDADPRRSASHQNLAAHLSGPFQGGAVDSPVPITPGANGSFVASVARTSRQPLLLVGTRATVGALGFDVTVQVTPRGGTPAPSTRTLHFAAFTEAGAFLPVWPSDRLAAPELAPAIDCVLSIAGAPDGTTLTDLVELRLCEGVMGRVLYLIGAEKARIRRQARELTALRQLRFTFDSNEANREHARMGHALDRLGQELGVPRLVEKLQWDPAAQQAVSVPGREPNAAYSERLETQRPFVMPSRRGVEALLQRFGGSASGAFTVTECNSEFAVAIQLVSAPDDAPRKAFLDWLRAQHLLAPGGHVPAGRLRPSQVRGAQEDLLARLAGSFDWPAGAQIAPPLAEALDRVGRCRVALGVTRKWKVFRAQDDAGGSRFELGLGVELELPPAAELDTMVQNLAARHFTAGTDLQTLALLGFAAGEASSTDALGRWLLTPCGFKTAHQSTADRVYLSHFPVYAAVVQARGANQFEARFPGPGDAQNAVLWYALRDVARDLSAAGLPAFVELTATEAQPIIDQAAVPAQATAFAAIEGAGLRTPRDANQLAAARAGLAAMPGDLWVAIRLDATLAAGVLAGTAAQVTQLTRLVGFLAAREFGSVQTLVRGSDIVLVLSANALAGAAVTLNHRQLGFRWFALPLSGLPGGSVAPAAGPRASFTPAAGGASLTAVVALALTRCNQDDPRGRIHPYEARIDLPAGTNIDLATYEKVMNVLERCVPTGVVIDTRPLREQHIDPAGSGQTVPFSGRLTHTYREFHRARHLGNDQEE